MIILEEQLQRKDLENLRNQVDMEKRVLAHSRQVTDRVLNQSEGFRQFHNHSFVNRRPDFNDNQFERGYNYMSEVNDNFNTLTPKTMTPVHRNSGLSNLGFQTEVSKFQPPKMKSQNVYSLKDEDESKIKASTHQQTRRSENNKINENINKESFIKKQTIEVPFKVEVQQEKTQPIDLEENFEGVEKSEKSISDTDDNEAEYKVSEDFSQLPQKYKGIEEAVKQKAQEKIRNAEPKPVIPKVPQDPSPSLQQINAYLSTPQEPLSPTEMDLFTADPQDQVTYT